MEKIRGVNFGNWLVLEKWMAPKFFRNTDAEDEVWMNRLCQSDEFAEKMRRHRETYITKEDFQIVAQKGLNLIRIPVPFFIFGDVKPFLGCVEYLDRAMDWAEECGVQILIDLHTVPGSQNGYDNGGITGVCKWCKDPAAVEFALTVLERLAARYGKRQGLYGIEVLNEPISWIVYMTAPSTGKARDKKEAKGSGYVPLPFLKQFYRDAYRRIRVHLPVDKTIVFHDGFRLSCWGDFFVREHMENVIVDTHMYLFAMENFVPVRAMWVYKIFMAYNRWAIKRMAKHTPVVVGEWCLEQRWALAAAEKKGKDPLQIQELERKGYQKIARLQLDVWEESAGWIYWSYQLYRHSMEPINEKNDMDGWALSRVWEHGWWPE